MVFQHSCLRKRTKTQQFQTFFIFPLKPPVVWGKSNLIKPLSDVYSSKKEDRKNFRKVYQNIKTNWWHVFSDTFVMSSRHFYMSSDQLAKMRPISEQTELELLHHLTGIAPFQTLPSKFHSFESKWDIKDIRLKAKYHNCWKKWWAKKKD